MFRAGYGAKFSLSMAIFSASCLTSSGQDRGQRYNIGIDLTGSKPPCPVFVMGVRRDSPAAQAGIKLGDRVTAVDGETVKTLQDAVQRITSIAIALGRSLSK